MEHDMDMKWNWGYMVVWNYKQSEVTCGVPPDNEAYRIFGSIFACPDLFKSQHLGLKDVMLACWRRELPRTALTNSPEVVSQSLPSGSKDPNNKVLGPKYYGVNGIWALKPHYLGPWTLRVNHSSEP